MTYQNTDTDDDGQAESVDESALDHSALGGTRTHSGDDLTPNSLQTGEATIENQFIYIFDGVGNHLKNIDPATTTTPLQDSIDEIGASNAGTIILPPTTIQDDGPITNGSFKNIIGHGIAGTNASEVEITSDGTSGIEQDPNVTRDWRYSYLDNWILKDGVGVGSRTSGSAIYLGEGNPRAMNKGLLKLSSWGSSDPVVHYDTNHAFESVWDYIWIDGCNGTAFQIDDDGAANWVGQILHTSGNGSQTFNHNNGGVWKVEHIQCLAGVTETYQSNSTGTSFQVGQIHHESDQTVDWIGDLTNGSASFFRCDRTTIGGSTGGTYSTGFRLKANSQNNIIGPVQVAGGASLSQVIEQTKPAANNSWYFGPSDDVSISYFTNNNGNAEPGVICLTDMRQADPLSGGQNQTISAGGTATFSFSDHTGHLNKYSIDDFEMRVSGRGSANDFGLSKDKLWYDESGGYWKMDVSETEGNTSVDVELDYQPLR